MRAPGLESRVRKRGSSLTHTSERAGLSPAFPDKHTQAGAQLDDRGSQGHTRRDAGRSREACLQQQQQQQQEEAVEQEEEEESRRGTFPGTFLTRKRGKAREGHGGSGSLSLQPPPPQQQQREREREEGSRRSRSNRTEGKRAGDSV